MKSSKTFLSVVTVSVIMLIYSCKKDSIISGPVSFNYFPVEKGKYVMYDVDSILHADNDNNNDDSVYQWHYQLKEVIDSTFIDGQGRPEQIIMRFKRDNDTLDWTFVNVWTQVLTNTSAYRTEDNVVFHKLSFPINSQATWNGNDANTYEEEMYVYDYFHSPESINGFSFDSVLSVLQRDDNNFIEKIYGNEKYANHVGLIYKERDDLRKVNGLVVKGTEFRMKIAGYGTE